MGRLLLTALAALALFTCGCANTATTANTEDDEPAQTLELEGTESEAEPEEAEEPEPEETDAGHPINPTGKTEYGLSLVGVPYTVGPVAFNCPASFIVTEETDDSIQLYDTDGAILEVWVQDDSGIYQGWKGRTDAQIEQDIVESFDEGNGADVRWIGRYDDYCTYSVEKPGEDGHENFATAIAFPDGQMGALSMIVEGPTFAENPEMFRGIADSLRPAE